MYERAIMMADTEHSKIRVTRKVYRYKVEEEAPGEA